MISCMYMYSYSQTRFSVIQRNRTHPMPERGTKINTKEIGEKILYKFEVSACEVQYFMTYLLLLDY